MALTPDSTLLEIVKARFAANMSRHSAVDWHQVEVRLTANSAGLEALCEMECTGGEPDVTGVDPKSGAIIFTDCAAESPTGRRSLCYDRKALEARKENKPSGAAMEVAAQMGIALLTEAQYRALQQLGEFDRKTSSWIATPAPVRALGGAIFCDRRYGQVFTYHNGADSYYAARGFRGQLII